MQETWETYNSYLVGRLFRLALIFGDSLTCMLVANSSPASLMAQALWNFWDVAHSAGNLFQHLVEYHRDTN